MGTAAEYLLQRQEVLHGGVSELQVRVGAYWGGGLIGRGAYWVNVQLLGIVGAYWERGLLG